ncbi:hypothetical protein A3Q56_05943 [Intoshia linei]|uniref:Uncharacterized protein n=1 Tax=Intoshia linei TaxID=1819745 RepID=A0A177AWG3_9BILA|nr:hypothetical protein A3Q56_05943 [Intoshia linei]
MYLKSQNNTNEPLFPITTLTLDLTNDRFFESYIVNDEDIKIPESAILKMRNPLYVEENNFPNWIKFDTFNTSIVYGYLGVSNKTLENLPIQINYTIFNNTIMYGYFNLLVYISQPTEPCLICIELEHENEIDVEKNIILWNIIDTIGNVIYNSIHLVETKSMAIQTISIDQFDYNYNSKKVYTKICICLSKYDICEETVLINIKNEIKSIKNIHDQLIVNKILTIDPTCDNVDTSEKMEEVKYNTTSHPNFINPMINTKTEINKTAFIGKNLILIALAIFTGSIIVISTLTCIVYEYRNRKKRFKYDQYSCMNKSKPIILNNEDVY